MNTENAVVLNDDALMEGTTLEYVEGIPLETGENGQIDGSSQVQRRRLERQNLFLKAYITGKGTIRSACIATSITRKVIYEWTIGNVDGFADRFELAQHDRREILEERLDETIEKYPHLQVLQILRIKGEWREKYGDTVTIHDDTSKRVLDLLARAGRARVEEPEKPKAIEGIARMVKEAKDE